MAADLDSFVAAISRAMQPQTSEDPPAADADLQVDESLTVGQIFLSREEVFSSELIDAAFIGPEGQDLRGPAALHNLATAVSLVNWLTTDDVLRQAWAIQKNLPDLLAAVPEVRTQDRLALGGVWAQLDADYPEPTSMEQARRQYAEQQKPRAVSGFPANAYLDPTTQAALRLWVITRMARDYTLAALNLRAEWWKLARTQQGMSRQEFERWFALDLTGIAGHRRGLVRGMDGNFFKDLGRSVSRLFKNPALWLRNVQTSIGRGLQAVETPFQWMRDKIPYAGWALGGILPTVIGELGAALADGSVSTFNEQRLVFVTGMHLYTAGMIIAAVGSVVTLIFPPLGAILVGIGALAIAVGRAILQFQEIMRQQRLASAAGKLSLIAPVVPNQVAAAANNVAPVTQGTGAGSGAFLVLIALGAALGAR